MERLTKNIKKSYDDYMLESGDSIYTRGEAPKSEYVSPFKEDVYMPRNDNYVNASKKDCYNKLGRIEDLLERYKIEDVEMLEKIIVRHDEQCKLIDAIKKWSFFDTFYKEDVGTFECFICNIHELGMKEDFKLIKQTFGKDKSE